MMHPLLVVLFASVVTAGLAIFIRACPWPRTWIDKKPLACPVCMSGWAGFAALPLTTAACDVHFTMFMYAAAWLACVCVGALVFNTIYPPPLALPE